MAELPKQPEDSATVRAIYEIYEARNNDRMSRRLGASMIGHPCGRKTWFDFRWAGKEKFGGRMLRLFETGHLAEPRFIENLKAIGCEVYEVDPETNQQFEYTDIGGHFVDKIDGACQGVPEAKKAWHACEFKTHSSKSFAALKKQGLRTAKPEHFAQLAVGMLLSGLPRGLYLAVNKDTDELYSERLRIEEVKDDAEKIMQYARQIIEAKSPPPRISEKPDSLTCTYCTHNELCFGKATPKPTCRSCVHATAVIGESNIGQWNCDKHGRNLSEYEQAKGCEDHLFIPQMIAWAEATDAGYDAEGDWIEYTKPNGDVWRNSKRINDYKSIELTVLPAELVGVGIVEDVKQTLGGDVVGVME